MYTKGSALEIQFAPRRLSDGAGDPYWIDLTRDEARELLDLLRSKLGEGDEGAPGAPLVFALDGDADHRSPSGSRPGGEPATPEAGARGDEASAAPAAIAVEPDFQQWVCIICGWVYDEAAGLPEDGIAPGTRWADIPDDWRCPECDVGKEDFAMVAF